MMKYIKYLVLGIFAQLIACAHYAPAQTGVYFYKGFVDAGQNEEALLTEFTFEFTDTVCELVVTAKGINESYLCSTQIQKNQALSVYFESFVGDNSQGILKTQNLVREDALFTLRFTKEGYITDWEGIYPSEQDSRSGTYFLHTYQK